MLQWRSISSLPWQEIGLLFFDTQNLQMEMSAECQLFMRSWLDDGWNWKAATLWESWWDRFATTDKSCWRGPAMSSLYRFLDSRTEITPRKFNITNRWYPELPFERRYMFHQWTSMDPCQRYQTPDPYIFGGAMAQKRVKFRGCSKKAAVCPSTWGSWWRSPRRSGI